MFYRISYFIFIFALSLIFACQNAESDITFNKDVAPIVHANCTPCHRPNQAGPFSLITYTDVKKRAKMVAYVTKTKYIHLGL